MKKIFLIILSLSLFGCFGEKPEIIPKKEKLALAIVATVENDTKTLEKLDKNMKQWEKLAKKGDRDAKSELDEWQMVKLFLTNEKEVRGFYKEAKFMLESISRNEIPTFKENKKKSEIEKTKFKIEF